MNASNDRFAQVAQDALYETGHEWEMHPSEAREQLEHEAQFQINEWLATGATKQFA